MTNLTDLSSGLASRGFFDITQKAMRIVPIEKRYEEQAYHIWKDGMTRDLVMQMTTHLIKQPMMQATAIVIVAFGYFINHLCASVGIALTIAGLILSACKLLSYMYVKSRDDLFDGDKFTIVASWGKRFFIALDQYWDFSCL